MAGTKKSQAKKKSKKNERDTSNTTDKFPINSYVLLDYPESNYHKGPPKKLMAWKSGPFRVINFVGNDYTIIDILTDSERTVNVKRLSPFQYDEAYTSPKEVASANAAFLEVEKIIRHRGHVNMKKNLEFLVKWKGYSEDRNSWLPHKDMNWNSLYFDWCKDQLKEIEQNIQSNERRQYVWPADTEDANKKSTVALWKNIRNILLQDIQRFENDLKESVAVIIG
jgi:hypothetical protein